jgi:hypothetical protein
MDKWKVSCIRSQDSLKAKVEKFEKEVLNIRGKVTEKRQFDGT